MTATMPAAQRRQWILDYFRTESLGFVDVLDADFVSTYIATTGAENETLPFGAPRCPQLGRDLARLHELGLLDRSRCGLSGTEYGFPKWVWVYQAAGARKPAQLPNVSDVRVAGQELS
jgi:hypothetical protein